MALLLVVAALLGGSVDAIACEPVAEAAISATEAMPPNADVTHGDEQQVPEDERHGACIHGHCHHGVANVHSVAPPADRLIARVDHRPTGEHRLASITPVSPRRPPRA